MNPAAGYTPKEAVITAVVGIVTVMLILALIAVFIIILSKIIGAIEKSAEKKKSSPPDVKEPVPPENGKKQSPGKVELIDVDEKTAAVIMAIVSKESDIPINRLLFKSIRLKEDAE